MPIRLLRAFAGLVPVLAVLGLVASNAAASPATANLRVVAPNAFLEPGSSYVTDTVRVPTDPGADCFGPPGGSGARVKVPGPTGLGIVQSASEVRNRLRPLSITDQFGFGLAVCGFGGHEASGNEFWYLKVNHVGAQVGGDQLTLHNGDDVLWYLAPSFPPPDELRLVAPARAQPNTPFQVTVLGYDDAGTVAPVSGASVMHAVLPTDANGHTMVSLKESAGLIAFHGSEIPSQWSPVCVNSDLSQCPARLGKRIIGTRKGDRIRGSRGWDVVRARGGNDRVNVRGRGRDRVNCGSGFDTVRVDSRDRVSRCEVVVHS